MSRYEFTIKIKTNCMDELESSFWTLKQMVLRRGMNLHMRRGSVEIDIEKGV